MVVFMYFFFSSRRRHTRFDCDWSSDVCSSDLASVRTSTPKYPGQAPHGRQYLRPESDRAILARQPTLDDANLRKERWHSYRSQPAETPWADPSRDSKSDCQEQ